MQTLQSNNTLKKAKMQKTWARMKRYKFLYLLLAPSVILHIIFSYLPIGGIVIAFKDYDIIKGLWDSPWCGFQNFIDIFTKPGFSDKLLSATLNTLHYSSLILFLGTPCPIILAILFNELKLNKFKRFAQTVSYLPHFLSWVAIGGIFYSVFATYGVWNDLLAYVFGIFGMDFERTNLMMDAKNFPAVIYWSNLWVTLGWSSIIYLSAIMGINQDLYDAAKVDGCNRFGQTLHVTIPGIMPTVLILFIMSFGGLFSSNFDQVFNLQNAYIQEETEVIGTLTYQLGIRQAQYSFTAAFGIVQSLISFILTWTVNKISKVVSGVGIW